MLQPKLTLFGPPQLVLDGQPIDISLRKAQALLVYLATTGQPHSRDTLATLLWPEGNQRSARANLRRTLHDLIKRTSEDLLLVTSETIALNPAVDLWLDVNEFKRYANEEPYPTQAIEPLIKAAALYRNDFMAGFTLPDSPEFDDWQFFQSEELRQIFTQVLLQLVGNLEAAGQYEDAVSYARRWLALDMLHEPVHRKLMELYALSGQQAAAVRQYDECVRILDEELGVPPEAETTALFEAIRTRRFSPVDARTDREADTVLETQHTVTLASDHLAKHNLPDLAGLFIGREREIEEVARRLLDPTCRLLTLIGPGGIGKTKLAIAIARSLVRQTKLNQPIESSVFEDGFYFVALQPLTSVGDIAPAIAESIGLRLHGDASPHQQVGDYLRHKEILLVLDNFEHLLDGAALVSELLSTASRIKILVTSREALRLRYEWFHPITGLTFPKSYETAGAVDDNNESIRLFEQIARRAQPTFVLADEYPAVVHICQLVDGMPLAIELAASWLRILPCSQIAKEIAHNIDILTVHYRDIPERHRNMRAVLDQAWQLLTPMEQHALMMLSVCHGGFYVDAAIAIANVSLPVLMELVEKSMLTVTEGNTAGTNRFYIHELLRQFTAEMLGQRGEKQHAAYEHHGHYFLTYVANLKEQIKSADQLIALDALQQELDNIKGAWRWATRECAATLLWDAIEPIGHFFEMRSRYVEGRTLIEEAATVFLSISSTSVSILQVRLLSQLGAFDVFLGNYEKAAENLQASRARLQKIEETKKAAQPAINHEWAFLLGTWADIELSRMNLEEGMQKAKRSLELYRTSGDQHGEARALYRLGEITGHNTQLEESDQWVKQSLAVSRQIGHLDWIATAYGMLGWNANMRGDYAQSERYWQEMLEIGQQIGNQTHIALGLNHLAWVSWCLGGERLQEARSLYEQALAILQYIGFNRLYCMSIADFSLTLIDLGEYERVMVLTTEGEQLARESGIPNYIAYNLACKGRAAMHLGKVAEARSALLEATSIVVEQEIDQIYVLCLYQTAELLYHEAVDGVPSRKESNEKQDALLTDAQILLQIACSHSSIWPPIRAKAAALLQQLPDHISLSAGTLHRESQEQEVLQHLKKLLS